MKHYIDFANDQLLKYEMGEIYVTDHEPRQSKVFTLNEDEDEKLYKYHQSLQEYNETPTKHHLEE